MAETWTLEGGSCDSGFPPFIRLTGKYWSGGLGNFYGGNHSTNIGAAPILAAATVNASAITAGRNHNNPFGIDTEVPQLPRVPNHDEFKASISLQRFTSAAWVNGATDYDPLFAPLRVRQVGWTGGIYTHAVGQVIRRRTGPSVANCTYWQCTRNTDEIVTSGGFRIVGNGGQDPSELPDYWTQVASGEGLAVNTFIAVRFTDSPRNIVMGDFVTQVGLYTFYRARKDVMNVADSLAPTNTTTFEARGQSTDVIPVWLQPLHCASYNASSTSWTLGNSYGYSPATPITTTLPGGRIVLRTNIPGTGASDAWRIRRDVSFPTSGDPISRPQDFVPILGRVSLTDPNYPTPYCNVAVVSQTGTPTVTRRFLHNFRYRKVTITTTFKSVYNYESGATSLRGTPSYQEIVEITPTGKVRHTPFTRPASMNEHPLAEPVPGLVTGSGKIGECTLRQTIGNPPAFEVAWSGDRPKFSLPGQYVKVIPISLSGQEFPAQRYYFQEPVFYPMPRRTQALIDSDVAPRGFLVSVQDLRTFEDIDRLFYPGMIYTSSSAPFYLASSETEQEEVYIPRRGDPELGPSIRWASFQFRWADTGQDVGLETEADPMIFVRQRLSLSVPNACNNES